MNSPTDDGMPFGIIAASTEALADDAGTKLDTHYSRANMAAWLDAEIAVADEYMAAALTDQVRAEVQANRDRLVFLRTCLREGT